MAMLLSRARMGLRLGRPARSREMLSAYSEPGKWSTFSMRMRYNVVLKNQTDPTIADFFYEKWLHAWVGDCPSYNYWFITTLALSVFIGFGVRQWMFNPDIYGRSQEMRKPLPDRLRQWTFSSPFFNHRLRNVCCKYKWAFIDNEPDYGDFHPIGYRPNRSQSHRRPCFWVFTVPRYTIEDPLFTSASHANMKRIYEEVGYKGKESWEVVED